jgi:hypothetical protein
MSETRTELNLKGLTNEELIMIYYRFDKYLSGLNVNLDKNVISKQIETPIGSGIALVKIPDEHVQMFKESQYYELLNSIVTKLKPIVSLIEECDPALKILAEEIK